ncbi:hypothetical protein ACFLZB_02070 [Nanoarchaeota archaeon]
MSLLSEARFIYNNTIKLYRLSTRLHWRTKKSQKHYVKHQKTKKAKHLIQHRKNWEGADKARKEYVKTLDKIKTHLANYQHQLYKRKMKT